MWEDWVKNLILLGLLPFILYNNVKNFIGIIESGVEKSKLDPVLVIRNMVAIIVALGMWGLLYYYWPEKIIIYSTPIGGEEIEYQ